MPLQLLHQVGHNSNWNVESFEKDACGDGLILSPLHQSKASVEKLDAKTRAASIFDPQFYLPSSQKPKLLGYPFFPENVGGGFKTATFEAQVADVAAKCIAYQRELGFRTIVVPTRFIDQLYTNYVERQKQFTVEAFIEASDGAPMCLALAVTAAMVEDHGFRSKLLNWITSYPNVDEVYVMYQHNRDTKQIHDVQFLRSCHDFFKQIVDCGLGLTVGYVNGEGILYSTVGDISLTCGAFENTRMFSVEKFVVSEDERRGPKARIYLPGLLNWVQFEDAKNIRKNAPAVWKQVYEPTPYAEEALALPVDPTFNQPQLYKHYFVCLHDQFAQLKPEDPASRRKYLLERLSQAGHHYTALAKAGIELEKHGRGGHVRPWTELLAKLG